MSECRRMKIESYLSPCIKLKPEQTKYLNIKSDTLNLMKEKVANSLELIGTGDFLNGTPKVQELR